MSTSFFVQTLGENEESFEYAKRLDKRMKEAKEKRQEQISKIQYLRKKETHPSSAPECSSQEMKGKLRETSAQKREREQAVVAGHSEGEGLATVKKARTAALPTDVPECPAAISGCQQKPGSSRTPASKGSASAATENPSPCSEGSCGEMAPASDGSVPPVGQQLLVMASADLEARSVSADPALLCQEVSSLFPGSRAQRAAPSPVVSVS